MTALPPSYPILPHSTLTPNISTVAAHTGEADVPLSHGKKKAWANIWRLSSLPLLHPPSPVTQKQNVKESAGESDPLIQEARVES